MTAFAAHDKAAEPVHLCAGVIERRDKDETVFLCLSVVGIFRNAGAEHVLVGKEDGFRLPCCPGGKVETAWIVEG